MRITGGVYRGRILQAPKGRDIRPTSDKVRLAVFNMLNSRGLVQDSIVIDAFCGTGALGIEALSWGANKCLFIDKNRTSLDLCKANAAALGADSHSSYLLKDSSKPGPKPDSVDAANLVFIDPPYRMDLAQESLKAFLENGWFSDDVHAVVETEDRFDESLLIALGFESLVTKIYGDTKIMLFARNT